VTIAGPLVATGADVVGVVGVVAVVADDESSDDESSDAELDEPDELDELVCAALEAVLVDVAVWVARPANRPVPATAPASDQLVNCLIRSRPASRSFRLRAVTARLVMTLIVVGRPKSKLRGR
jgi:hypothetical protein